MSFGWVMALVMAKPLIAFAVHAAWVALLAVSGRSEPWWVGAAAWPTTQAIASAIACVAFVVASRRAGVAWWPPRPDAAAARAALLALPMVLLAAGFAVVAAGVFFLDPRHALFLLAGGKAPWWLLLLGALAAALGTWPLLAGHAPAALQRRGWRTWAAVALLAAVTAAESVALPFVPARAFALWRGVAFLPSTLLTLLLLTWRPRLLAFVVVGHGLGAVAFALVTGRG
jgi:hypothetical protein